MKKAPLTSKKFDLEIEAIRSLVVAPFSIPSGSLQYWLRRLGDADIGSLIEAFHKRHDEMFAFSMPWRGVEFLTFRLKASAPRARFRLEEIRGAGKNPSAAQKRTRACWFDGRKVDTPVYDGDKLMAGNVIAGPAIIEERTTTAVVPGGFTAQVDQFRNCILQKQ